MPGRRAIAGTVGALALALPGMALAASSDSASTSAFVAASTRAVKPLAGPQDAAAIGRLDRLEAKLNKDLGGFTLSALDKLISALSS